MNFIKRLLVRLNTFLLLRKKSNQRLVKVCGFNTAKSIGILINTTNYDLKKIAPLIEELKAKNSAIKTLCFQKYSKNKVNTIQDKEVYFSEKDFSRLIIKPKKTEILDFINESFDLLLCFDLSKKFHPFYITQLSNAKFKAGITGNYRDKTCDFLLDIKPSENENYIIENLKKYLTILENGN